MLTALTSVFVGTGATAYAAEVCTHEYDEQPIGNKLFVGSLNENGSDKSKKAKNRFSLLFPNQDTAGVTADSVKEPVFDTDDVKRKRAKEKLYGKKDDKKVEALKSNTFAEWLDYLDKEFYKTFE